MPRLVWLDLETTGLDENKDQILELVAATADLRDPFNVTLVNSSVLWHHPSQVARHDQYVIDMHTKNGLWKECANEEALDPFEVQDALLKSLPDTDDRDEKWILAGSTVHFDRGFLKTWMPKVVKLLHHRHLDVSSIKIDCESQGMPKLPRAEAHRAWDDIQESMAHLKLCREWQQSKR